MTERPHSRSLDEKLSTARNSGYVLRGDARNLPLADASVDLIVTSPPYFALRSYQDGGQHYEGQIGDEDAPGAYIATLLDCTEEWVRVLKPSGSLWVNLGDKYADKSLLGLPWRYALGCVDALGLILRAEVIWSKPNGLPESVTDRVRRSHEQWFHFTQEPRYFAAMDRVREAYLAPTATRSNPGDNPNRHDGGGNSRNAAESMNPLGKLPGSVWTVPTQPLAAPPQLGVDHFAAFPMEWPRRIIRGWCPPSGVVLDPFGGTGTTALVAAIEGRTGISVDLSHDYSRLATWRTTDPGERARAMQVEKPAPQINGQVDLFGDAA